jgi:hypothetical protein
MKSASEKRVRVEVTQATLLRLLRAGQVCADELRCLDDESKQCLWRLCLQSCVKSPGKPIPAAAGIQSDVTVFPGSADAKKRCTSCEHGAVATVLLETA